MMNDEIIARREMQIDYGPRTTDHGLRPRAQRPRRHSSFIIHRSSFAGFTLLELLAVIAIMGIIAAIALPSISALKPNSAAAATRQMRDAVTYARQLAMSQRTTLCSVFRSEEHTS